MASNTQSQNSIYIYIGITITVSGIYYAHDFRYTQIRV